MCCRVVIAQRSNYFLESTCPLERTILLPSIRYDRFLPSVPFATAVAPKRVLLGVSFSIFRECNLYGR